MVEGRLILSLETATRSGSLALLRGGVVVYSEEGIANDSHSVNLLYKIDEILKNAGTKLRDIDVFATASGPGSFTGLRIGLATIKAFSVTFNRACIGVPTLEAIAFAGGPSKYSLALLPAGRGEVFAQAFMVTRTKNSEQEAVLKSPLEISNAVHIPPRELLKQFSGKESIRWVGAGAQMYSELIRERANELDIKFDEERASTASNGESHRWTLADSDDELAKYVGFLAERYAKLPAQHRAEDLHAIYVRPSDAELNK